MKPLLDDNRIVENITVLLYSRTYEKLFCEFYDKKKKATFSKISVTTSDVSSVPIKGFLKTLHILIKKSEDHMQILDDLNFNFEDLSIDATV